MFQYIYIYIDRQLYRYIGDRRTMSKKLVVLIDTITSAVAAIGAGIVTYVDPSYAPAIVGAIGIVEGAVISIINLFKKDE